MSLVLACTSFVAVSAANEDPLASYFDGKPPAIIRDINGPIMSLKGEVTPLEGVATRQLVIGGRDGSEIHVFMARPQTPGKHPSMLVLHGGGGIKSR